MSSTDIEVGIEQARRDDPAGLQEWIQAGGEPNQYDQSGWTPLLWAAARGNHGSVAYLLGNPTRPADPRLAHRDSGALGVHMAGQSGSVASMTLLLDAVPEQLNAVLQVNAHTPLLQAVFYGHLELAEFLAKRGASFACTTARGLGPIELARQFQNRAMIDLLAPYDTATAEDKAAYYRGYLASIAPVVPSEDAEAAKLADDLGAAIAEGIAATLADPTKYSAALARVQEILDRGADVNRLAGPLGQPALIVAVTGNNGDPRVPEVAALRAEIADLLLARGADPALRERHPMAVQTIIRAAVFNHLDILKKCAAVMDRQLLADCINAVPAVNGLTAMHDTVLRTTMAGPDRIEGYLAQAQFLIEHGGRPDVEDFSGVTPRDIASRSGNPELRARLLAILDGTNTNN